jgi:hypothetical protein
MLPCQDLLSFSECSYHPKSGTNEFMVLLYAFFRNQDLNAKLMGENICSFIRANHRQEALWTSTKINYSLHYEIERSDLGFKFCCLTMVMALLV